MNYPRIIVDTNIIKENTSKIVDLCRRDKIDVVGVTKAVCGNIDVANAFIEGGVKYLGDSRIENLIRLKDFKIPKIMLRLPMISEVGLLVRYADISLNSEIRTIEELSRAAIKEGKIHKIILMIDLGDLREGIYKAEEIYPLVSKILNLKGIKLVGIGTNLTCYGGLIPSIKLSKKLTSISKNIEDKYNINLEIISGGNSSSIHLLGNEDLGKINNLRLGESLLLGRETSYGKSIRGTRHDTFILEAEIIEIKDKPSLPKGKIGMDAFGERPIILDRGIRRKILCAIGKQDIKIESLFPKDKDLIVLGGSSDHLILDSTDSKITYKLGDIIKFNLSYGGILSAMTSSYVKKCVII